MNQYRIVTTWLALVCAMRLAGGCPSVDIEGLVGSGGAIKVGYVCGSGCDTRYYLAQNGTSSYKMKVESWSLHPVDGVKSTATYSKDSTESNTDTTFKVEIDPTSCAYATTSQYTGRKMERYSSYERSWDYSNHRYTVSKHDATYITDANNVTTLVAGEEYTFMPSLNIDWDNCSTTTTTTPANGTCSARTVETTTCSHTTGTSGITQTETQSNSTGMQDEYTTDKIIARAESCATADLSAKTFGSPASPLAISSFSLDSSRSTCSINLGRWRLAVSGTDGNEEYVITLQWEINTGGKTCLFTEERDAKGSDQKLWYYPQAAGERIELKKKDQCDYSFSKKLVGATIRAK